MKKLYYTARKVNYDEKLDPEWTRNRNDDFFKFNELNHYENIFE